MQEMDYTQLKAERAKVQERLDKRTKGWKTVRLVTVVLFFCMFAALFFSQFVLMYCIFGVLIAMATVGAFIRGNARKASRILDEKLASFD